MAFVGMLAKRETAETKLKIAVHDSINGLSCYGVGIHLGKTFLGCQRT
jgi:hypothetical protein